MTVCACSSQGTPPFDGGANADLATAKAALASGDFQTAYDTCSNEAVQSCDFEWCTLLADVMLFVSQDFNGTLLSQFRSGDNLAPPTDLSKLLQVYVHMGRVSSEVDPVAAGSCHFQLDHMPVFIGQTTTPLLDADARGDWTPRDALWLGAMIDSFRYIFAVIGKTAPVPTSDSGVPGLPTLLASIQSRLVAHDQAFFTEKADPNVPRGGWLDVNGDGKLDPSDRLLVDLFVPNTDTRVFDFSQDSFITNTDLPTGSFSATPVTATCGYSKFHIDTLIQSAAVGTTDGMTFSPDGTSLYLPIRDPSGIYQIQRTPLPTVPCTSTCPAGTACALGSDGGASDPGICLQQLTSATSWSDGVRFRPNSTTTLLFISNRDHANAIGGAGGGAGQELYAMRADGSQQTRLTVSGDWATNYHANWSNNGKMIVWGSTQNRTWDVMVADFIDDASGMHLGNIRKLTSDTTWWETHGFTHDDSAVITTNTRAGLMQPDEFTISLADGALTRITNHPAWDEHGHLSPDGSRFSWISGRWRNASVQQLCGGQFSPLFDFWWIDPAIFWAFVNPPAGYSTELTLMNTDGIDGQTANTIQLTSDNLVVADNEWSTDGKKIVFRQSDPTNATPSRIRLLTFDDCP